MWSLRQALAIALVLGPGVARAVNDYHTGDRLICADCHSMHYSMGHGFQGGPVTVGTQAIAGGDWLGPGGPNPDLLKLPRDQLCVACHDGSGLLAPNVVTKVGEAPAGGAFTMTQSLRATSDGHTLGARLPKGLGKRADASQALGCTTCHSPHGSESFRNLREDPAGRGERLVVVARKIGASAEGSRGGSAQAEMEAAYDGKNIAYQSGMSSWCRSCHADLQGHGSATLLRREGASLAESSSVDVAAWLAKVESRVRVERSGGDGRPSPDDRVFCLTCHRAHGSGNRASLIFADGATLTSTCQQCHNE